MTNTVEFNFDTPSEYELINAIVMNQVATLPLTPDPVLRFFSKSLNSAVGFTYNTAFTLIGAGTLSQIDQRPLNATFFAAFRTQLNANWSGPGNGSLVVTPFNGAAINSTQLDLTGSVNKSVLFSATNNADSLEAFSVEFQVIPNYSGTPSDDQVYLDLAPSTDGSDNNCVQIDHFTDGHLYVSVFDNQGNLITDNVFAGFNPTAGTTYTILLQSDGVGGITRLFINGTQESEETGIPYTRDAPIADGFIGQYHNGQDSNSNFSIKNFAFYSAIVTPPTAVLSSFIYEADTILFPAFNYPGSGSLVAWSTFTSGGDVNAPGYIFNGLYWNGAIWLTSNGTYAQSNPLATASANFSTLPAANSLVIEIITQSGSTQSIVTGPIVVDYIGQSYASGSAQTNLAFTTDNISSFSAVSAVTGSDSVTFAFSVDNLLTYWSGTAWSPSDGQLPHTNSVATISANLSTLLTKLSNIEIYALLNSASGNTSPNLTSMTVGYDFVGIVALTGFVSNLMGGTLPDFSLTAFPSQPYFQGSVLIPQGGVTFLAASGFLSGNLQETESTGQLIGFTGQYTQNGVYSQIFFEPVLIPNVASIDFSDLLIPIAPET